jgi:hypothetical protein
MKKILYSLPLMLILSCSQQEPVVYEQQLRNTGSGQTLPEEEHNSYVGNILKGNHYVKNISRSGDIITFMWENNQNEWVTSQLHISKIRYKFEENTQPYVKFKWKYGYESYTIDEIMEDFVLYAVIVTSEQK